MPQKGGFTAAGWTAKDHKFALLNRKGYVPQGFLFSLRICKIYIFE